jgi:FAD/FMN-containing dehydrogenase
VQLDSYGGAINRITPEATAFCHRNAKFNLQYQAYWSDAKDQPAALKWIDACRASMQPYVTGGAYVNYCDRALPNWLQAYYGENLTKLRQIKQKYDPENFFTYDQSIPPAAP